MGKVSVHFDNEKYNQCELNKRCPVKVVVRVATLTEDDKQHTGASHQNTWAIQSPCRDPRRGHRISALLKR